MATIGRRPFLIMLASASALTASTAFSRAETGAPPPGRRVALRGYDPVSYFTKGQPEKGDARFWFAYDDAVYQFASADHRAIFAADPEHYAPQYDGFCAAGLSKGYKEEPDPEAWAIVNDKLYVVALKERIAEFKKHPEHFIGKADANWQKLRIMPTN
jgi:YHS domain-containing protein